MAFRAALGLTIIFVLFVSPTLAQVPQTGPGASTTGDHTALAGKWIYRSFHNNPQPVNDDAQKALDLIFAEATFTFEVPSSTTLEGAIDWPGGGLDLKGIIRPGPEAGRPVVEIVGTGRPGTGTDNWEYDYFGQLAHHWPNGVNQIPTIVGTVIRAKPHGQAKAGYVASFIAVKQP